MVTNEIKIFASMSFDTSTFKVWKDGILPIERRIKEYNIKFKRVDETIYVGETIGDNVISYINECDMLIADVSLNEKSKQPNPSVMHEIGYATALGIPVILYGIDETYKFLPANLRGRLVIPYTLSNPNGLVEFSVKLQEQIDQKITSLIFKPKEHFTALGFTDRSSVQLPSLIEKAAKRVQILTTNLTYTKEVLLEPILMALQSQKANHDFKVNILTMDPESNVANERADQLNKSSKTYRDELRNSLESMSAELKGKPKVIIKTFKTLPTQMFFIIDDQVVVATVTMDGLSRQTNHFLIRGRGVESFVSHFTAVSNHKDSNNY